MKTKIYITSTFHSLIKGKLKITKDFYQEGYFIIDTACTNNIVNNKFCNEESSVTDATIFNPLIA